MLITPKAARMSAHLPARGHRVRSEEAGERKLPKLERQVHRPKHSPKSPTAAVRNYPKIPADESPFLNTLPK